MSERVFQTSRDVYLRMRTRYLKKLIRPLNQRDDEYKQELSDEQYALSCIRFFTADVSRMVKPVDDTALPDWSVRLTNKQFRELVAGFKP